MEKLSHHIIDQHPWGSFEQFTLNEPTTVKLLTVAAGEECSLQTHQNRDEFWRILSGSGTASVGTDTHPAYPGDSFFIPRNTPHRVAGGAGGLQLLEISFGQFDEADITRLADHYGRV